MEYADIFYLHNDKHEIIVTKEKRNGREEGEGRGKGEG